MDSFHRSDWLSLAQTGASILAIAGAYGVVFFQHHLQSKREQDRELEGAKFQFGGWHGIANEAIRLIMDLPCEPTTALDDAREYFLTRENRLVRELALHALNAIRLEDVRPYSLLTSILELRLATAASLDFFPTGDLTVDMRLREWLASQGEIDNLREVAGRARHHFENHDPARSAFRP
ncbi:hypothetical protein [Burkholderia cepacia]|uniref:hypothetical protein n=1 Tax=Burkholderia cepacia TaxID=292 RepID=UPI0011D1D7AF|nr:hypothetical protein [Burkholderia cepacia]